MNKTAIKNFAMWARRKLITDIQYKSGMLGITENGIAEALPQSTKDLKFFDVGTKNYVEISGKEIQQRDALVAAIKEKEKSSKNYKEAFEYIVEEVAFTWFNRLIAIRFMEVNEYLPSGIRVLSSDNKAKNEPDFVTTPFDTDLVFTPYEQDRVIQLKDEKKDDELFRMLFIKQCNKLHDILPELFEQTDDYTELLLTISFTDKDGVVYHLVHDIDEDDFNIAKEGQVEIIGWMYQFYNSEPKDLVFAKLKKNIKISKEDIPAATQIFTPDWIVKFMVENSLGKLWCELHKESDLNNTWDYFVEEAEQKPEITEALKHISKKGQNNTPESIKFMDPCMGSGHILVYAFDVLMQIYESYGYTQRDATRSILTNNIFGIDIDKRAYQLAYFAVMMKARQYNRRILTENIHPNLYVIEDSGFMSQDFIEFVANGNTKIKNVLQHIHNDFKDAIEYGSLIKVEPFDYELLETRIKEIKSEFYSDLFTLGYQNEATTSLLKLIQQAKLLSQTYDVVVTNPPYSGRRNLSDKLCEYLDSYYPESKMDLFSAFVERNLKMTKPNGYTAFMTPFVWLYLSSFTSLRNFLLHNCVITTYLQPEESSFKEAAVSICSFVLRRMNINYKGTYFKLSTIKEPDKQCSAFLSSAKMTDSSLRFYFDMEKFSDIPDQRFVFWMTDKLIDVFNNSRSFESVAKPRQGMATSDNDRFLRMWYEVDENKVCRNAASSEDALNSGCKWFPYNKGGGFRKWYGNNYYLLNYENDGKEVKDYAAKLYKSYSRTIKNIQFYFKKCVTWSDICGSTFAARACTEGYIFDVKGSSAFVEDKYYNYILALLNSNVCVEILNMLNPSITTQVGDLKQMPFIFNSENASQIATLAQKAVGISKWDWDNYEISTDFQKHPLLFGDNIERAYTIWSDTCTKQFTLLKETEETINELFIRTYGLDNISVLSDDKDIAVRLADLKRDVKSLLSYAVGCMFGRYSLDVDGVAYAGGDWDDTKYSSFIPDKDNCIPITDEEYFEDDIVGRLVNFIKAAYGENTVEENLDFIAKALGNKGNTSREVIRNYFLNDFIKDHIKTYQKRPIYWMFDSGKQNGFKSLVYMHRWNADTTGNMRIEYLHRMQKVYEKEIERMQEIIDNSNDNKDISYANKRKEKLQKQLKETKDYDSLVAHLALSRIDIDLDDGVKVNYEKVQTSADGKKLQILTKF